MENREYSLAQVQAWMQEMLVSADAPGNTTAHVAPSSTLSAEERLAIYQRGYLARLLQCLEGQYKALCHALGKGLGRHRAISSPRSRPASRRTRRKTWC